MNPYTQKSFNCLTSPLWYFSSNILTKSDPALVLSDIFIKKIIAEPYLETFGLSRQLLEKSRDIRLPQFAATIFDGLDVTWRPFSKLKQGVLKCLCIDNTKHYYWNQNSYFFYMTVLYFRPMDNS